jgi:hypothetical protein
MDILLSAMPGLEVCDFCSDSPVYAAHECIDFTLLDIGMFGSTGGFAACEKCHSIIVAEEWDALVTRSVESFLTKNIPASERDNQMLKRELTEYINKIQIGFRKNRTGRFKIIGYNKIM